MHVQATPLTTAKEAAFSVDDPDEQLRHEGLPGDRRPDIGCFRANGFALEAL